MTGHEWEAAAVIASPFAGIWLWRAIFRPMAPCLRCGGQRRIGDSERWRNRECEPCGNTGQRMTWSGRMVRGLWGRTRWGA